MKIHRFIGDFDLNKENIEITGEIAKQIRIVLKLKIGEKIELCNNQHFSAIAEICSIGKNFILVKIDTSALLRQGFAGQNTAKKVILFCAVLKKENFELVVQKTTECGVSKIIPVITSRTVKTGLNMERLKKIAREASEQSGRTDVPEIYEPIKFTDAIKLIKENNLNIFFDASGEEFDSLYNFQLLTFNLFVGPEGGWTPEEIKIAKENNFEIASLGNLTLRGETAAIIATYLVSNLNK